MSAIQAEHAMDTPEPEEQAPEEPAGPSPELQAIVESNKAIAEGQKKLTQAMGQLIRLVQADRERIPMRREDGSVEKVLDRIVMPQPESLQ